MLKRIFSALFFLIIVSFSLKVQAQDADKMVKGKLVDTVLHQSLGSATVELRKDGDSTIFRNVRTDSTGSFTLSKIPTGKYLLSISFQGYLPTTQSVVVSETDKTVSVPTIQMTAMSNDLNAVVVTSVPPVTIKADTTEFNAAAYHVKPNSNVEDLIKKMPGVDVDANGNIKAQGESVTRVYVNGKRFFGDDPKMATQNLPPDVVDKIQVFDALSDQSQFTGFDDGNRVKSINIVTKKNAQAGYFGKIVAGGGKELSQGAESGIYAGGAAIHRFDGNQQISLLLQANNNNQQMFTSQDILGTSGRGGGGRGGGGGAFGGGTTGLTKTLAAGLNYRDQWGKSTSAYGSYFYNNQNTTNGSNSLTKYVFTDTMQNNTQNALTNSKNQNQNHRIQFNVETNIDSMNSFIFRPNFTVQNTDIHNSTSTDVFENQNGVQALASHTTSNTYSHNNGYNGTLDLLLRHKFAKAGRTLSADITWTGNDNDGHGTNFGISRVNRTNTYDTVNQQYTSTSKSNGISTTLTYTEPIAKYQLLQLAYNYSYTKNNSNRNTYNFDSATMAYTAPNLALTNNFENTYTSNRATLSYLFNNSKINFSAGTGVQFGHQESINSSKGYDITRNYVNMYPTLNFRYLFTKTSNLRFNYQGRTSQPSISQLQPITDSSNQLNITSGNPNLKQSFAHSFRLLYSNFDRQSNRNMFGSINFSTTQNAITNMITRLSNGGQSSVPVNLNGNYNLSGYFNYGFPISTPKSNLNFSTNISLSKTPGLLADTIPGQKFVWDTIRNNTNTYSFSETFKWTTNLDSLFDINIFTTPSYVINRYSQPGQGNNHYFSHATAIDASWYTSSGWILTNNFTYTYYRGLVNTSIPLWNISFSRQILKNKRGEIKISVYDLLNQNKSISQATGSNYVQQTSNIILKRYAQLTFTYNIRNFAGQQNKMPSFFGGERGGGGGRGGWGGGRGGRMD